MKEYRHLYIVTEYDFDGIAYCSHMFWDIAEACDKHREIHGYGGEAEVKYQYRMVEM